MEQVKSVLSARIRAVARQTYLFRATMLFELGNPVILGKVVRYVSGFNASGLSESTGSVLVPCTCWKDSTIRISGQRFREDLCRAAYNEIYRIIRFRSERARRETNTGSLLIWKSNDVGSFRLISR